MCGIVSIVVRIEPSALVRQRPLGFQAGRRPHQVDGNLLCPRCHAEFLGRVVLRTGTQVGPAQPLVGRLGHRHEHGTGIDLVARWAVVGGLGEAEKAALAGHAHSLVFILLDCFDIAFANSDRQAISFADFHGSARSAFCFSEIQYIPGELFQLFLAVNKYGIAHEWFLRKTDKTVMITVLAD